ncbi:DNA repair protein RecO [Bathymodiolus japonicus methanotrophic gill symbiont]|uniref:DNA repair protein RecO n=1 Tax=Bathymodiolus japonicus methanotrophic gill symbiont TaxID=113269 RepID=UPI001C8D4EB3|nr:DNA repair protein RecO [Bathymodiolus japonicus methanotrophic gill symbiont]
MQAGFLLHHQNYRESSLIIDVFTQSTGRVSLIAKGVRQQKAQYMGVLRPFIPLNISYIGSGNLKTLCHVETGQSDPILPGLNTYCGFYLNELLRYFIPAGEPYPDVFLSYIACLQQLKSSHEIEAALRIFETRLLQSIGYGLQLEFDYLTHDAIQLDANYQYDIECGATLNFDGQIHGATLIAMQQENHTNERQLNEAKLLMRRIIDFYLQGKPLKSRTLITQLIQKQACKNN